MLMKPFLYCLLLATTLGLNAQDWEAAPVLTSLAAAFENPEEAYKLELRLSEKGIASELELLKQIHKLKQLRILHINEGRYAESSANLNFDLILPKIAELPYLIELHLESNDIALLPERFGGMTNLKTLNLYDNKLTILPPNLSKIEKLETLLLSKNRLTNLINLN